jgi:4-hydroxy-2-oxoheptanedioate aldolase
MRRSRILEKINRGETALGVTMHLTDPSVFEMVALLGFDGIWMDMEHHGYTVQTAQTLMRAARIGPHGGSDIIARPGKGEFMRMGRMLESGATGIMYPRCSDPEEAREVVRWAKYAPIGQRGFDGAGADAPYCMMPMADYVREANKQTFVLIQLEEPSAIDQAEAVAAIPGVDMIMLGPADFTVLTGIPGQFDHPSVDAAVEKIARAARNTGKHWASTTASVEHAKQMSERGARLVFHGADVLFVKNGLEAMRSAFSERLGLTFGDGPSAAGRGSEYSR